MRAPIKDGQRIMIRERAFDPAECDVVGATDKAVCLFNVVNCSRSWFPRAWLKDFNPEDDSYAGEYFLPAWVQNLSRAQERVLNISE